MSDEQLAGQVHRNLMEVSSWMAADGDLEHRDGELLVASASELPFLNIAMREPGSGDPGAFLGRAREFFFGRGRGFVLYTHPADAKLERAAGDQGMFEVMARYPKMVCRGRL